jgi:hypothetical protein
MSITIPSTACTDEYSDVGAAIFDFQGTGCISGYLVVSDAPIFLSLIVGTLQGQTVETIDYPINGGFIPLSGGGPRVRGPGDLIFGIRARNYTAGTVATITGTFFQPGEAQVVPGVTGSASAPFDGSKVLVSRYEAQPAAVTVPPLTLTRLDWAYQAGPVLFDLSNPTFPVVLRNGVYRYWATVIVQDDSTAVDSGAQAQAELDGGASQNYSKTNWPIDFFFSDGQAAGFLGTESFCDAAAGDGPQISLEHNNTLPLTMGALRIIVAFQPQSTAS